MGINRENVKFDAMLKEGTRIDDTEAEKRATRMEEENRARRAKTIAANRDTNAMLQRGTRATPIAAEPPAPIRLAPSGSKQSESRQSERSLTPNYPAYQKDSSPAKDFRRAFAAARSAGKTEFVWQGRKYNTKVK